MPPSFRADNLVVLNRLRGPTAGQGQEPCARDVDIEPIFEEPRPAAETDQP